MNKPFDFFKTYKNTVLWTGGLIAAYYFIFLVLFGFNLFSLTDWSYLASAHLRGFGGLVFGVLILSALPLVVATTVVTMRKPLFTLSGFKKKKKAPATDNKKEAALVQPEPEKPLPTNLPPELKTAFLRARQIVRENPALALEIKNADQHVSEQIPSAPVISDTLVSGLPLPNDFDFLTSDDTIDTDMPVIPVFKEIDFEKSGNQVEPDVTSVSSKLIDYLEKKNYTVTKDGDVIVANGMVIVTHADSDFWIADTEDWFAAGKQKKSPIMDVIGIADRQNLSPVLYLAEQNIMDLDKHIAEWESQGVKVITKPSDID